MLEESKVPVHTVKLADRDDIPYIDEALSSE